MNRVSGKAPVAGVPSVLGLYGPLRYEASHVQEDQYSLLSFIRLGNRVVR